MSKKIYFESIIDHNGEKEKISFEAEVTISNFESFKIFEFKEPQNKVMNRIEVAENKVNIFAGPSSINLELDKNIAIQYETPHGVLLLISNMSKINFIGENNIKFNYSLSKEDEVLGQYQITLKVK